MDLIDKDALLQKAVSHGWSTPKWVSDIVIDDAPTIEAEPVKHGRWLKTGQSLVFPEKFRNYFCSECGLELDKSIRTKYRYCPNCGARMDLDEVEK